MTTPQSGILPEAATNATFITLLINNDADSIASLRRTASSIPAMTAELAQHHADSPLVSTVSFGAHAWDTLFPESPRPKHLAPFKGHKQGSRQAPSTPGDILIHIRSVRQDINFDLSRQIMDKLIDSVQIEEEIHSFRYQDSRDMIGFVDGTENPQGNDRSDVALVGDEDAAYAGGSYINCQRYVHAMNDWEAIPIEHQEQIIGRTKADNIEFDDKQSVPTAHIKRVNIKENGKSLEILRHSLPYGDSSECGLFFIAYARSPKPFDRMLEQMIHADHHGHYDHLLNFTLPVTGCAFFAPSIDFLAQVDG
ncbi:MAG: Dyp-type peroxidase [Endozoicomonadaceae bacterium]|nr:Dyp-type peroxidase [Endozoicomonadaceae bacterium]